MKDCFGLHGHYAFGSVAKEKSGVGRKSATSVGLTTDLVHCLQAGKTVDFLRCASEINRLSPPSALSIFRINHNSFHLILAVSNDCRIFATRISATPLIQAYQGGTYFFIDAMQYTNRPLTIQDQISRLQNNGLIISDVAKAESELKNISYFRLADYLQPMESDHVNHTFKPGSKIEDAISMYYFDKELRSLIFNAIQTVEVSLRSKMIQIASVNYGSHWYMDSSYFTKQDIFFDCFTKIGTEVKRSKEDFIKEYFSKYSVPIFPPVWKTLEVISFGTLSKIYENIKEKAVKKAIANEFQLPTHVIFENWVQCTAVLRNLCCHHNRVWNRRYAVKPQLPKTLPLAWITQFDPIPTKIYWQLCCLLYMENAIHPGNGFSQSLKSLFAKYPSVNPSAMGFPKGWDLEPLWK